MKIRTTILAALLLVSPAFSQTDEHKPAEEAKFYRFDFVVKDSEAGKMLSSRAYSMTASPNPRFNSGSVRTGEKVPVPTGKDGQFTFVDVGVNIDCVLHQLAGNNMIMKVSADITSAGSGNPPVINQNRWNSTVVVPVGKPTTIFSADGATSKRQMQLELTVTPIP